MEFKAPPLTWETVWLSDATGAEDSVVGTAEVVAATEVVATTEVDAAIGVVGAADEDGAWALEEVDCLADEDGCSEVVGFAEEACWEDSLADEVVDALADEVVDGLADEVVAEDEVGSADEDDGAAEEVADCNG